MPSGRVTPGLECRRGRSFTGVGALFAPGSQAAIDIPMWRSIASISRFWRASTNVIARPERPTRPVRPIRCTYVSGLVGTS